LIGTHLDADKKADRTRPICPYPTEAKYKGGGDINEAGNFSCTDPGKLPQRGDVGALRDIDLEDRARHGGCPTTASRDASPHRN